MNYAMVCYPMQDGKGMYEDLESTSTVIVLLIQPLHVLYNSSYIFLPINEFFSTNFKKK